MNCFNCNNLDTKVSDSRLTSTGTIRRRRECLACGFRFSTLEEIEILDLVVLKSNGSRESYQNDKLMGGLKKAFEKRPFTARDLRKILNMIEIDIQKMRKKEIETRQIGEIVMKHLKEKDKVAYIRFASVYNSFDDAETFRREIKELLK